MNEIEKIDIELGEKCAAKNIKIINEEIDGIKCDEGGINSGKLWKLKKKMAPKAKEPPSAKLDTDGNYVITEEAYKKLHVDTFKHRLRNRDIQPKYKKLHEYNMELFQLNRKLAKNKKTPPWTVAKVKKVLGSLKKGKSRDPWGLTNELFRLEVAGDNLIEAITLLMNEIKSQGKVPELLNYANITSFWKGKGSKNDMENERGVFRIVILRYILDRLIYNDEYETIDSNLTDSNVGSRKGRNIRDNLFVLNAIINSTIQEKSEPIDLEVMDLEKCFDSLCLEYTINGYGLLFVLILLLQYKCITLARTSPRVLLNSSQLWTTN